MSLFKLKEAIERYPKAWRRRVTRELKTPQYWNPFYRNLCVYTEITAWLSDTSYLTTSSFETYLTSDSDSDRFWKKRVVR